MKILRVSPSDYMPRRYTLNFDFDSEKGVLSGTVGTAANVDRTEGDLILDFNINLNDWVGRLVECRIIMTEAGYEIMTFDPLKNYSLANGMPTTPENRLDNRYRLFRIFVHENIDESIIQVFWGHDAIEGFEDIEEDGNIALRMFNLVRRDSLAEQFLKLHRIKSDMLGRIDQRNSVSYLEAQVDILTRLYLQDHPEAEGVLINLLKAADAQSVLDIKDSESVSKEFTQNKALVRAAQKDFYAKRTAQTLAVEAGDGL